MKNHKDVFYILIGINQKLTGNLEPERYMQENGTWPEVVRTYTRLDIRYLPPSP